MPRHYRVVNVGSHVNPPGGMWAERFPAALRERAPHLHTKWFDDEQAEFEVLTLEGVDYRVPGVQVGIEAKIDTSGKMPFARTFNDGPAANREPAARVAAQDVDGIDADVITHPGYPILLPKDRATRWGLMYAFNDWLGEFCRHDPARLIGVGELPMWDMELAVSEAKRIAKLGLRGVMVPAVPGYYGPWSSPADHPYISPFYEPLWRVLEDLNLVMVIHPDTYAATEGLRGTLAGTVTLIANKTLPAEMIASLIVSQVFENHPGLKLVCVETGVGWMAHLVSWLEVLARQQPTVYAHLREPLAVYFRRHVFGSFLWDTCGIANRDIIGIDNIMWCNDFPHTYGPWPHSRAQIDKDLAALNADERHKVLAGNAVRVFGLT